MTMQTKLDAYFIVPPPMVLPIMDQDANDLTNGIYSLTDIERMCQIQRQTTLHDFWITEAQATIDSWILYNNRRARWAANARDARKAREARK